MILKTCQVIWQSAHRAIAPLVTTFARLFYRRTILILAILLCIGEMGAVWNMSRLSTQLIESQAIQNAKLYAQAVKEARTLYSAEAVSRVKAEGLNASHDYLDNPGTIPLPATYLIDLGRRISEQNPGMSVRLYSDYPFPWRQAEGGAQDKFGETALQYLKQHPEQPFVRFEQIENHRVLRYAQADVMKASCVGCHNTYPGTPKRDWKVGDVRGILEITTPLDSFIAQTRSGLKDTSVMLAGLSGLALSGLALVIGRLRRTSRELEQRVIERTAELQSTNQELVAEQEKSNRLLLNILPEPIATELKEGHSNIADGFAEVTVLFADLVQFTQLSEKISPAEMVKLLNDIFSRFDGLTAKYGLEKIKTIGDAYMVAGGLPVRRPNHAEAVAEMALAMQAEMVRFNAERGQSFRMRIGINTGPVVAGVIGTSKFIYDLWGDTVNIASRMESHGVVGGIQVTEATYVCLKDRYQFQPRGPIQIKGKGEMVVYLLVGKKHDFVPVVAPTL